MMKVWWSNNDCRRTFALWISTTSIASSSIRAFSIVQVHQQQQQHRSTVSQSQRHNSSCHPYCHNNNNNWKPHKLAMSTVSTANDIDSSNYSMDAKQLRVALCQFHVTEDKVLNLQTCANYIDRACVVQRGTDPKKIDLIVLPEIWNSPYATAAFADYAEPLPNVGNATALSETDSPSAWLLQQKAVEHQIWIVGGSVPECDVGDDENQVLYNTCLVFNPQGHIVAKHRKVHLFDINVPGGITFYESDTLAAGSQVTSFTTPWCNIGIGICYDIRFPEYALLLAETCQMLIYPGAFNLVTGPAHWELLQRGRAVDTQSYVLTASPARTIVNSEPNTGRYPPYTAWGHSTVVAPWGDVIATTDETESIVVADIDLSKVDAMRQSIPVRNQKRNDLYTLDKKLPAH
jgi:omega-amidase